MPTNRNGCQHDWTEANKYNYAGWHMTYAPAMHKKYGRQEKCMRCGLYLWPNEFGKGITRNLADAGTRKHTMILLAPANKKLRRKK